MKNSKTIPATPEQAPIDENLQPNVGFTTQDMGDGRTRLRVQFDITYKGSPGKTPTGEKVVEPDMTLRLGQLLERHSRGKEIPMKQPVFFDMEIPTFSDLTDVDRYREQLERRLEETKQFIAQEKEAKADKDALGRENPPSTYEAPRGASQPESNQAATSSNKHSEK